MATNLKKDIEVAAAATAAAFKETHPPTMGCIVITFDFGNQGWMGYAATGKRDQCLQVLREFLQNFEGN